MIQKLCNLLILNILSLSRVVTSKWLLLQTVKTKIKCCLILHYIRVLAVCSDREGNIIFFGKFNL